MIDINNIYKSYHINDKQYVAALLNINLKLKDKRFIFVLGKSGSGKTTLLNIIGGIDNSDSGSIIIDSQEVTEFSENEWDNFRNKKIGFVFQEYNLIEGLSVYDNLLISLSITNIEATEFPFIIKETLKYVGMNGYENRKINELSVGQKQRIAIARAIIKKPNIVIADEPTGSLDQYNANEVFKLLEKISQTCLVILVTHDKESAYLYADQIIEIENGKIINDFEINKNNPQYLLTIKNNDEQINEDVLVSNNYDFYRYINSILSYIQNDFKKNKNTKWNFGISVESQQLKSNVQEQAIINEKRKLETKKLPDKNIIKLSKHSFSLRKKRLIANIIMFTLTLFLTSIAILFAFYDVTLPLKKYIKESNYSYLTVADETKYTDKFFREHYSLINKGEEFYKVLEDKYGENRVHPFFSNNQLKYNRENLISSTINNVNIVIFEDTSEINLQLIGRIPNKANEIIITDYIAYSLELLEPIGCTIIYNDTRMEVVGVKKTDYLEFGILEKLQSPYISDFSLYKIMNEYKIAYIHNDTLLNIYSTKEVIKLPISNFSYYNNESMYLDSYLTYGPINIMDRCELIWGQTPKNQNEVLIHISFAETLGYSRDDTEFAGFPTYKYIDIESQEYNDFYKSELNLFKYIANDIKVVGIFSDLTESNLIELPNVLINDNLYKEIENKYYSYFIYSGYYVSTNETYYNNDIDSFAKSTLIWDEPSAALIYNFKKTTNYYLTYIIAILIILYLLTIMMNIALISSTIFDSSKMIGILRAVGVRRMDTLKIFLGNSLLVGLLSSILSIILTILGVNQINSFYLKSLEENKFDILMIKWVLLTLIIIGGILINIIASIIPIIALSKRKVVQLFH